MAKWYLLYPQLADRLSRYYEENPTTGANRVFELCYRSPDFRKHNEWIDRFAKQYRTRSIDPIHIFASLNEFNMPEKKRTERLFSWFRLLDVKTSFDPVDFAGCPAPVSVKLMSVRKLDEQREAWNIFQNALRSKQKVINADIFQKVKELYGVDLTSFTIFLFWIDSNNFLPLDKNSSKLLRETGIFDGQLKTPEDYKKLLRAPGTDLYREIALKAIELRNNHKATLEYGNKIRHHFDTPQHAMVTSDLRDFRIIAIRPLKGINPAYLKVLKADHYYRFYTAFQFPANGDIVYDPSKYVKLYSKDNFNINISAIVGRNGSGKSTITELLFMALNNISAILYDSKHQLKIIDDFRCELYFKSDQFYKFDIDGKKLNIFCLEETEKGFGHAKPVPAATFNPEQFFSTVALNYSLYGLNSKLNGKWLQLLYNNLANYQVPFSISPNRMSGNIDINFENNFISSILLTNILEKEDGSADNPMRRLTDKGQTAERIRLTVDKSVTESLRYAGEFWDQNEVTIVLQKIYRRFRIPGRPRNEVCKLARATIYHQLLEISHRYKPYRRFTPPTRKGLDLRKIDPYLDAVEKDQSHVTAQIKQAINFLKFPELFHTRLKVYHDIETIASRIQNIKKKIKSPLPLRTIDFIPPGFLERDILLNDGSSFNALSSGEKQKICTAGLLSHHLLNMDSLHSGEELLKYRYVNIIFDEVELYFHPDMQRTFISYLLNYIGRLKLEYIECINFCFITHSPFILSDIPAENILFMETSKGDTEKLSGIKTFGANIHELLVNGFFMDQTLGQFAADRIKEILEFHDRVTKEGGAGQLKQLQDEYGAQKKRFYYIKESIGEKYISNLVGNHILDIERLLKDESYLQTELNRLEKETNEIKKQMHVQN